MKSVVIALLMIVLGTPMVSAHGHKFSETAKAFIDEYKVEVLFYPEDIANRAESYEICVECRSFAKTHDVEAYKEHAKEIEKMLDSNSRYTYSKDYVGYDVYRAHLAKHHKDEKFIGAKVYVSPTEYRTQAALVNDASRRKAVVAGVNQRLKSHLEHIKDEIETFLK